MSDDRRALTAEQAHIVDQIRSTGDNLMINALAGTGKTTTLELVQAASKKQPVLCLAFNRPIMEEMAKRMPGTTTVRTFNGCGHRIWSKTYNVTVNPKKVQELVSVTANELSGDSRRAIREAFWEIVKAVDYAKSIGYIPEGKFTQAKRIASREAFTAGLEEQPTEFELSIVDSVLVTSISTAFKGNLDYNDQVYMPALFGGTFPRFPFIMVDEAQDLSPVNHLLLDRLVSGRLCVVGDPQQSIYAFRGALTGGMQRLRTEFEMTSADLSISFRCPQAIVEAVRWRVPNFKWIKPGGVYAELRHPTINGFADNSAIICRNNAPLFRLAFRMLAAKRSVQVAGSDIGPKLIGILKKIGAENDRRADLFAKINAWKEEKLTKSTAPQTVEDMAACLRIFAGFGSTLSSAVAHAEHLFKQQGTIKLLTGHKAKGREWDNVYHLDEHLIGTSDQELNLRYVITTRARAACYEIKSEDIR